VRALLARLLGDRALYGFDQAREHVWRLKGGLVRARADAEIDAHEHRAVHDLHPLFADGFMAVKVDHEIEVTLE